MYHYLWLFMVEFGLVAIYGCIFVHLRHFRLQVRRISDENSSRSAAISPQKISKFSAYMVMYPAAYVILTLPLAAGRMISISHESWLPTWYWFFAASFITSCGWVDTILYAFTRKKTFQNPLECNNRSITSSTYHNRNRTVLSLASPYLHGTIAGVKRSPLSLYVPESPYSHPNDTIGTLSTTTNLVRSPNTPSPSIYSANRQRYSTVTFLSSHSQSRPNLTLVTDLEASCPGYGYPPPQPSAGIDLDDLPPAAHTEMR
jgi:hypothetical protein